MLIEHTISPTTLHNHTMPNLTRVASKLLQQCASLPVLWGVVGAAGQRHRLCTARCPHRGSTPPECGLQLGSRGGWRPSGRAVQQLLPPQPVVWVETGFTTRDLGSHSSHAEREARWTTACTFVSH